MINVAICDDDRVFTGTMEKLLRSTAAQQGFDIHCDVFFDGSDLIRTAMEDRMGFDLVYLDIEMAEVDGIRAALALREAELPTLVVYISVHEERLKDLFRTEPFRFLSKPVDEAAFRETFFSACERVGKRTGYFTFSYKKALHRIPFGRITCFESHRRVITIHLPAWDAESSGPRQTYFYGKLNDIEKQMADLNGRFLRIHQSFLVNFDYIKTMSATEIEMLDGRVIQISEDRRKEARAKFLALADVKGDEK